VPPTNEELMDILGRIEDPLIRTSATGKVFPNQRLLHLDFETASSVDLRKVGASVYSRHPDTIATVIAWAFDNGPVFVETLPKDAPYAVLKHLHAGGRFVAWNAAFEWAFLTNYFGLRLDPAQAVCSMQQALYAGLPAKLEHAGVALSLPQSQLKDVAGHRLMLQMSRPKKDGTFWHDDPAKLAALASYCKQDVIAERAIHDLTPPLPDYEKAVSLLDRRTNDRGIRLDLRLIHTLLDIAKTETAKLDAECKALTGGIVTSPGTQTARLLTWLWGEGVKMATVGKEEVQETLDTAPEAGLPPLGTKVLAIRQKVAKSSVKKLQAMLNTVDDDGRVRGTLQYYGASRTGRFSGRLIQPQNFPRPPKGWNPLDAINAILDYGLRNEGIGLFYGEPLSVVSACLRGCLIPSPGKHFMVFDLSQIEARALAWLSGQHDVLEVFRKGEDVYIYTSDRLGLGSRQAGKVAVLGLGYGMGHEAFVDFARANGLIIDRMESLEIVSAWRDANAFTRQFWWDLDAAAKNAIQRPGTTFRARGISLTVGASHGYQCLLIRLPSGRDLWYRNPRLVDDPDVPGRTSIVFDGVDQYTKQWTSIRTWGSKLAENVTQAVARDIIAEAALRVSDPDIELVLSVHDEVLLEVTPGVDPLYVKAKIETVPKWAAGLPVACEGGILEHRYGKI
jgi:DNA polymerase